MPSVIGAIQVENNVGVSNFGDTLYDSQKNASKTFNGSGAVNTGNFIVTNNGVSATTVLEPHLADQNIVANA